MAEDNPGTFGGDAPDRRKPERPDRRESDRSVQEMASFPRENPNPVLRVDPKGDVLLANFAANDLIGKIADSGKQDRAAWAALVARAKTQSRGETYEISVLDRTYTFDIVPIVAKGYVNLYGSDVTHLRWTNAVLSAQSEGSPDGILVVDKNARIASHNRRFLEIWNVPPDLVATAVDDPVLAHVTSQTKNPEAFLARVRYLYDHTEEAAHDEIELADGRFLDRHSRSLYDNAKKYIGRVWFFRDITERKRAEERLRIANAIVDASPTVLFRWAPAEEWPIVYVSANVGRVFGYAAAELTDPPKPFGPLVHADDGARVAREVEEHVAAGRTNFVQEYRLLAKSGEFRWVEDSTSVERDSAGRVLHFQGTVIDVTERKRAEDSIKRINRVLRVLSAGNAALVQASDEPALLAETCRILVDVGGYRMAWVGFAQQDAAKTVRPVAHAGHEDGYLDAAGIVWADNERGRGPTGTAIRTGTPQVNRDVANNPAMTPWREAALKRGFASSIALPLKGRSGTIGALTMYAAEPDAFDTGEVELLVELSHDLAYGIGALRDRAASEVAAERLQRSMETTVEVVAGTLEQRDPYTAGHQRRVAMLAEAIARRMGLAENRIHGLRLAGIVHDLGKIYVPAEILSKPSRLTPVEYGLIKTHAQVGYDILKNVDFPWPIAQVVLQHHERMDGTGYPNGLKDGDILLESRILAVADVVESMMSHRPYRPTRGLEAALAEIERGRGTAYDPAAVDACLALFRQDGFEFD